MKISPRDAENHVSEAIARRLCVPLSGVATKNKAATENYPMRPCQPRPDGQEVTRPCSVTRWRYAGAFMHSLCALARSSLFMPAVFLLHIAILLSGFAGAAD